MLSNIKNKVVNILMGQHDEDIQTADALESKDPEYLTKSPLPLGYDTTADQLNLYMNLLFGYNPSADSIMDVGAGRGDLFGFIKDFYETPAGSDPIYYGFDRNPNLVDIAQNKWGVSLDTRDIDDMKSLPSKNWVVAAGFFFERRREKEDDDLNYLLEVVDKMYNAATTAVSFNLRSPINNEIQEGQFYVHPGLIMDMMIEKYQHVTVKHNYSNSIYTVTIYKF